MRFSPASPGPGPEPCASPDPSADAAPPGDSRDFYAKLDGFRSFADFSLPEHYRALPSDWHIAITDVEGSTAAIRAGRYRDVNAVATASIVAMLNAAEPVQLPYAFGGDGATVCIPGHCLEPVRAALAATRRMAGTEFGLTLRAGTVPVEEIYAAGHELMLARFEASTHFRQAMFLGDGLNFAEMLVKDPVRGPLYWVNASTPGTGDEVSFDGFECRWLECPSPRQETVALMIQVLESDRAARRGLFDAVYRQIARIYGEEDRHHPLSENSLRLTRSTQHLNSEIRIRTAFRGGVARFSYWLKLNLQILAGRWLMRRGLSTPQGDWGRYKGRLVANTDWRKCDETLRMILSGTAEQRLELVAVLDEMRQARQIVYGVHVSDAALLTCLIHDYQQDHVHFLDAADGGYAMAAQQMKQQLASIRDV